MLLGGDSCSACGERFALECCQPCSPPTLSTSCIDKNNAVSTAPSAIRSSVLHHATVRSGRRDDLGARDGFMTLLAAHYASVWCHAASWTFVQVEKYRALGRFDSDRRVIRRELIAHDGAHARSLDRLHVLVRLAISTDASHVRRKESPTQQRCDGRGLELR
jgi:hypothetical protein